MKSHPFPHRLRMAHLDRARAAAERDALEAMSGARRARIVARFGLLSLLGGFALAIGSIAHAVAR